MDLSVLRRPPFGLGDEALDWVGRTAQALSPEEQAAQLFVLISTGTDEAERERIARLKPGGVNRFFGPDGEAERAQLASMQSDARVPLLVTCDLEGSRMSLPFGTHVPNPLALAAIDDEAVTSEISRIMAREARATGINWSFTPVVDINRAFRSAIVATRGYGSDVETIRRHALAQIREFQANGVAATVKHWPGEGFDDRDQHLLTTINPSSMEEWRETFGRLYGDAIEAGVLAVMSAHIALPARIRSNDPDAGLEAYRPASLSRALTHDLLREEMGFNGVIVSDASEMAGLTSWMPPRQGKVQLVLAGCDVVLFSQSPEEDMAAIAAAVADGTIPRERFEGALVRVLGLKAALGLHQAREPAPPVPASQPVADAVLRRAPSLVKDVHGLFPLDQHRHRRVLVYSTGIVSPLHGQPQAFSLPAMLEREGFEVTLHEPGMEVSRDRFDLVLYLFGEETLLTRGHIFLDWLKLGGGDFRQAMARHWHEIPTAMISFGYPYYLYDAPRVPAYINAWCTMDEMQAAVVGLMLGRGKWNDRSPVDPFCGLEDARY